MVKISLRKPGGEHIFCQEVPADLMRCSAEQLEGAFTKNANTRGILQAQGLIGQLGASIFDESDGWYADTANFDGGRRRVMVPRLNAQGLKMIKSQLESGFSTFGLEDEEARGILEINRRRISQQKKK